MKDALTVEKTPRSEKVESESAGAYFLENEPDTERGGDVFMKLQDPACTVMTRNQRNQRPYA